VRSLITNERVWPIGLLLAVPALAMTCIWSPGTWLTLTFAGLASGIMLFIMASGLSMIFGLMDVLNFGHGAFITIGAYTGWVVLGLLGGPVSSTHISLNVLSIVAASGLAILCAGLFGLLFERVLVRKVYGDHLKQILITLGGAIVIEQLVMMIWGPQEKTLGLPVGLSGTISIAGATIERYRVFVIAIGLAVLLAMHLVLTRTRLGLIIRAGVQDREMVEALGYRIDRVFVLVFMAGAGLAGFGGVLWTLSEGSLNSAIGSRTLVLILIVIMIGGPGSIAGTFVASLLVALMGSYMVYLAPKVALATTVLLMVSILMWRPGGLFAQGKGG
jgi:branched-chain amino acid transport system permease protein